MVVFTCNHCGETLHKPKVEKHYQFQCRNYKSVSCVDCFKDFRDEEYVVHTKCITEDERYAAKGTYKNGIVKKGEVKQESWLEMIRSICDTEKNLRPSLRNLLNIISGNSNVPRKKIKFMNFVKSSLGGRANMNDVEEVWNLIETYKNRTSNHNDKQTNNINSTDNESSCGTKRSQDDDKAVAIVKKKRKLENSETSMIQDDENMKENKKKQKDSNSENGIPMDNTIETIKQNEEVSVKFDFKQKILEIVTKKGEISIKKLQKKVLKSYSNFIGGIDDDQNAVKKFNKKLKKISSIKIENESVVFKGA
ncbi:uncharacterized protein LOC143199040 [Rhynchophorus ferrugineus]|uniref:Cell growth-regulating nucleolar protein n=1 Tax=Rhynchophorus ferrugineus TaxID=354439 RepID=A0A834IYF1_RHYFE|nr:hypothetical protein GWI33_008346 [Rhynchophorus ferrugineus]